MTNTANDKGPKWKRMWKKHKEFLYHKSEKDKDLYCGRTCKDWFYIFSCVITYYLFLALFWYTCFALFKIMIIENARPFPYRKGYMFSNEKIKEETYPIAYKFSKTVKKELSSKENLPLVTMSHLDFPMLSLLPHRFDGGANDSFTDDDAPGEIRNAKYSEQAKHYWKTILKHNNGKLANGEKVLGPDEGIEINDCSLDNFYDERVNEGFGDNLLMKTACRADEKDLLKIIEACDAIPDTTHVMDWSYNITANTVNDFKPCFIVKLNNIVGMVPVPWKGTELEQMYNITIKGNGTKVFAIPSYSSLKNATEDGQYKLPLACWLNIMPNAEESKKKGQDLNYFFDSTGSRDFLTFIPGPYIDLRQYPYMANAAHPNIPTVIKVNYNDAIKPQDVISMDCRVFAKNIPYKYLLDTTPANKFGHVRVRMKYYEDKNAGKMYWKLEK